MRLKNNLNVDSKLNKLLKLNIINYTNKTFKVGKFGLPEIFCENIDIPDYIALSNRPGEFNLSNNTIVGFFLYDSVFDNTNSLFMAIYYNDKKILNEYRRKYSKVKYFIEPDRSQLGDVEEALNIVKRYMSRVESLWLTLEMNKIVVPIITYSNEQSFEYMLDGLENTKVVCFSTKGSMKKNSERTLIIKAIKYTVDHLKNLTDIIVYSTCLDNAKIFELFRYATEFGILIHIPDNRLLNRNRRLYGKKQ